MQHKDKDVIVDSVWAVSSIAGWGEYYARLIVRAGIVPHLVNLLRWAGENLVLHLVLFPITTHYAPRTRHLTGNGALELV